MTRRLQTMTLVAALLATAPLAAQWRNLPTDGIPRGADGKPDMNATTPRTAAGKPDLSGIYQPNMRYFQNLAGLDEPPQILGPKA